MIDIRGKANAMSIPGIPRTKEQILNGIIKEIWGVSFDELKERTRKLDIRLPRQLYMTILNIDGYSYSKAAEPFGLDHATTINAKKRISNIIETKYPKYDYDRIIRTFERYKENFEDFSLSELHRNRKHNYNGIQRTFAGV